MSRRVAGITTVAALIVVLCLLPVVKVSDYYQNLAVLTFLLAIGATGWNMIGGYAGYISLGSSVFIGLGAYTTGILAAKHGVSPWVGCWAGGLVAALGAGILSLSTRRTRGVYFTIVTFAALQLVEIAATTWSSVTGGSSGLAMPLPTWSLTYEYWPFYYSLLALLIIAVGVSAAVRGSKLGLGLFAIQDDEDKVTGLGIDANIYKGLAFVLGSLFLGVAGGIYAYDISFLNTSAFFDIDTSMLILLSVLLGGRGTLFGPVLGAFIVEPLSNLTSNNIGGTAAGSIRLFVFGGLLGAVAIFLPRGILPTVPSLISRKATTTVRSEENDSQDEPIAATRPSLESPAATREANGDVLEATGLGKAFGGVQAVAEVDLKIKAGAITGLIGPNGCGKTTVFNLIDGTVSSGSGVLTVRGKRIDRRGRARRAHAGLGRTYQLPRLFPSLTVLENVVIGEPRLALHRLFLPRVTKSERARALHILDELGLAQFADVSPTGLSYGQRKLIELAQILWLEPALILLDEPAAGISPALIRYLSDQLVKLRERGVAVLVVEHNLGFLADLCDTVYVMAAGHVIANGRVDEISTNEAVVDAYLGDDTSLLGAGAA
jgi:branched-chain amino acid transport system permease protein